MIQLSKAKIEYGDFQTPIELACQICDKLVELGVNPDVIIEPTCGIGNFLRASSKSFRSAKEIIGLEINSIYINEIREYLQLSHNGKVQIKQENFFQFDWMSFINKISGNILVLGNLPWVTNSQQGIVNANNLPPKNNFQNYSGLNAITGKSNFDISEWMSIRIIECLQNREAYFAMLCKTSVARKLLNYTYCNKFNLDRCAIYKINAKKFFGVDVEACLFFCQFNLLVKNYFCDVFQSLEAQIYEKIGYEKGILVKDLITFKKVRDLYDPQLGEKWRSGIKHDCSNVMELRKIENSYVNGLGELVEIEDTFVFPLIKGSDVAQNRIEKTNRYILVTQRAIGEPTEYIKDIAPKTWNYLESHASYLDARKSKIYNKKPRFSIFGVGNYTFLPWKIAICGLYKKLNFKLIGSINGKSTIFDDTVYFLSFETKEEADRVFKLLNSSLATDFYSSAIFWDEKRPIKTSILNSLNLSALAQRLSV